MLLTKAPASGPLQVRQQSSSPALQSQNVQAMRLPADGKFHLCLLNDDELDVKKAIRAGDGAMEKVADILLKAVRMKPTGHHLLEGRSTHDRSMYQIGG